MHYKVTYRRDPAKALRRMQNAKAEDVMAAIERAAADPWAPNNNLRPLKGIPNGFRVRVGDRVSYTIDREGKVLDVFEVAPRGGRIDERYKNPLPRRAGRQPQRAGNCCPT